MDILKSSQLVIFSHSTIVYNIFLQKSCRFSLQILTKFEAAKTGSGVGFLRLTAVWVRTHPRAIPLAMKTMRKSDHGFPFVSHMSMGLRLAALRAAGAPL